MVAGVPAIKPFSVIAEAGRENVFFFLQQKLFLFLSIFWLDVPHDLLR
jgi:hypothetical protein